MYELLLPSLCFAIFVSFTLAMRALVFSLTPKVIVWKKFVAFLIAATSWVAAIVLWNQFQEIQHASRYRIDHTLITIYSVMYMAIIVAVFTFIATWRQGWILTPVKKELLLVSPAIGWTMMPLAALYIVGPIPLEFFGKHIVINHSFGITAAVFAVYFLAEYVSNPWIVEAKFAALHAYFEKRTGKSATEGYHVLPGFLPLTAQVLINALFRRQVGFSLVRPFITAPVTFTGTVVAMTQDHKLVIFTAGGVYQIVDHTKYDDMIDDNASNPREALRLMIAEHFKQGLSAFTSKRLWDEFGSEPATTAQLVQTINAVNNHAGLKLLEPHVTWLGFQDQELQAMFQAWAGRDIRKISQETKLAEIETLRKELRRVSSTYDPAHVWEGFNNGGRGTFKILG